MADLFTEEFYRTAALKLRPGGIFCQWVQCYQTSPATLRDDLPDAGDPFPARAALLRRRLRRPDHSGLARPGGDPRPGPDRARVGSRRRGRGSSRAWASRRPPTCSATTGGGSSGWPPRLGPGPTNTDDNGWLEHRAPSDLLSGASSETMLVWSPEVGIDLAASIVSDRGRALALLDDAAAKARSGGSGCGGGGIEAANGEQMRARVRARRLPALVQILRGRERVDLDDVVARGGGVVARCTVPDR